MKRLIYIICVLMYVPLSMAAEDRPVAFMKAQYKEWHKIKNTEKDTSDVSENKYVLQIGRGVSYYYDPQTYYVDSLENDPTGKAIRDQAMHDALNEFMNSGADAFAIMRDKGLMAESRYKNQKDFRSNIITVWNTNGGDVYQYETDMNDLNWEICDSTKIILDYDCNLATADYHGRKWKAWFAPEVAIQEGPWQLCGLPGLIFEAETEDGEYGFEITGIQKCNESFKPILIDSDNLFNTPRKSFLKMKDYARRNRSSRIRAMTGGKVKVDADYKGSDDFLETDYHE
ncbi:GLPGLI family protein [uncultured Muribaculum sp.]|uniref:GLPGLI family protein n=1 Tax=uncultured Muribaculum sp. TaxID=1918613 RepID=UPI0027316D41|nr:GLPGLI family protein [uncultured Muribaculum sp.]